MLVIWLHFCNKHVLFSDLSEYFSEKSVDMWENVYTWDWDKLEFKNRNRSWKKSTTQSS